MRDPCESKQTKLAALHFKRGDWCAAYGFLCYEYIEMQTHSPGETIHSVSLFHFMMLSQS